jgi:hypothetical protein
MNDQSPMKDSQPEPLSRREARQQRREARNAGAGGLTWVAGILLIVLGIAFLMDNLGSFSIPLDNWWALFVLIRPSERLTRRGRFTARPTIN